MQKNYIRDKFFTLGGKFKTDILNTMQTPALFALKNGIFEGKIKDDIIFRLRENFEKHGNCLQTGFLGTSILMPTLTETVCRILLGIYYSREKSKLALFNR